MANPSWDDTEELAPSWDETEDVAAGPDVSLGESGLRGSGQGLSMGFDDEIAGGLSVLGRPFGIKGLGGKLSDIELTSPTLDTDEILGEYSRVRDAERANNADAERANPKTYFGGQVAGGVGNTLLAPGLNAAKGASLAAYAGKGALQGGITAAGLSNADNAKDFAMDTGVGAALGGGAGAVAKGVDAATDIVTPYLMKLINKSGDGLKNAGGKLMEKATGATGKQAEAFTPGAGRRLIEEGYGKAFDDPAAIAKRAEAALNASGKRISSVLDDATASGAKIDLVDFLDESEQQVMALRTAGKNLEADALEARTAKVIEDAQRMGLSEVSPSYMENVKRESQANINYNADTKPLISGKKAAASIQRQAVEDVVGQNPAALEAFKKDKDLYGLLSPVQEAAEKRANTLNQSPIGGLLDMATGTVGSSILGGAAGYGSGGDAGSAVTGALLAGAGRRYVAPRIASTVAVGIHNIGDLVQKSPQAFGKYANVLQQASQRGPQGVASTHFLLQQTEPDYRLMLDKIANGVDAEAEEVGYGYPER